MQAAVQQPRVVAVRTPQGKPSVTSSAQRPHLVLARRWSPTLHRIPDCAADASAAATAASVHSAQRTIGASDPAAHRRLLVSSVDATTPAAATAAAATRRSTPSSTTGCHAATRRCYLPSELGRTARSRATELAGDACCSNSLRAQMSEAGEKPRGL